MWRRLGEQRDGPPAAPGGDLQPGRGAVRLHRADLAPRRWPAGPTRRPAGPGSLQARRHALVELLARRPPAPRRRGGAGGRGRGLGAAGAAGRARRRGRGGGGRPAARRGRRPTSTRSGWRWSPAPDRTGWLDRRARRAGRAARGARPGGRARRRRTARSRGRRRRGRCTWPACCRPAPTRPWPAPTSTCSRCCWPPSRSSPPTCASGRWPRCGRCRRAPPPAAEETLRAWLDAHGDVTATAAALHVHPQTVRYRLAGLREAFGGALDDPARTPGAGRSAPAYAAAAAEPALASPVAASRLGQRRGHVELGSGAASARAGRRRPIGRAPADGGRASGGRRATGALDRRRPSAARAASQPGDLAQHLAVLPGQRARRCRAGRSARRSPGPAGRSRRSGCSACPGTGGARSGG